MKRIDFLKAVMGMISLGQLPAETKQCCPLGHQDKGLHWYLLVENIGSTEVAGSEVIVDIKTAPHGVRVCSVCGIVYMPLPRQPGSLERP